MAKLNFKQLGMNVAGLTAGAVGANMLVKFVPASMDNKIVAAIQIAAGALLPELLGKKSPIMSAVGNGMIAVGGASLVADLTAKSAATSGIYGNYEQPSRIMGDGMEEVY